MNILRRLCARKRSEELTQRPAPAEAPAEKTAEVPGITLPETLAEAPEEKPAEKPEQTVEEEREKFIRFCMEHVAKRIDEERLPDGSCPTFSTTFKYDGTDYYGRIQIERMKKDELFFGIMLSIGVQMLSMLISCYVRMGTLDELKAYLLDDDNFPEIRDAYQDLAQNADDKR